MHRQLFFIQPLPQLIAALIVLTSGSIASAQEFDELFAQTDGDSFAFFDQANGAAESPLPAGDDLRSNTAPDFDSLPAPTQAADRNPARSQGNDSAVRSSLDLRLSNQYGSQPDVRQPSKAMQIRQARALAEMRSRDARLEAERWGLLPSLRPSWSSNLMMENTYPSNVTYLVPVYIWSR